MCQAHTFQEGKGTKFLHSWTDPLLLREIGVDTDGKDLENRQGIY